MTLEEQERALKENRAGTVAVSKDLGEVYPEIIGEIKRRMVVIEEIKNLGAVGFQERTFRGYSPEFKKAPPGEAPLYLIVYEFRKGNDPPF